jgi:hypothetical protein
MGGDPRDKKLGPRRASNWTRETGKLSEVAMRMTLNEHHGNPWWTTIVF